MSDHPKGLTVAELEARIANSFIEMLERDGLKSFALWATVRPCANGVSGHVYRGSNVFTIAISMMVGGWSDTRFITFNQARSIGANVRKGEKGTPIVFYGSAADKENEDKRYRFARVRYVWNIEQLENVDEDKLVPLSKHQPPTDPVERNAGIDAYVAATRAVIRTGTAAFFEPSTDTITMPPYEDFLTNEAGTQAENYYSVLLHELVHWTGHESRLDRLTMQGRRSQSYAFEELVAEIGSVMLCVQLGLQSQPSENNAAYVAGWITSLKDHPATVFKAASAAGQALQHLNSLQGEAIPESEAA